MSECPWYVTAAAVRQYQNLRSNASRNFDDASDELIELCAGVWERYQQTPDLAPLRIEIAVSMERRPEGPKGQVVDVLSIERDDAGARAHQNERKRQSPSALRRKAARAAALNGAGPSTPRSEDDVDYHLIVRQMFSKFRPEAGLKRIVHVNPSYGSRTPLQ